MSIARPAVKLFADGVGSPNAVEPASGIMTGGYGSAAIPLHSEHNWLFQYALNGIRYLASRGISEWSASETAYVVGSRVLDDDGAIYQLFGTASGTHPKSDRKNWARVPTVDEWGHSVDRRVQVHQNFLTNETKTSGDFTTLQPGRWSASPNGSPTGTGLVSCGIFPTITTLQPLTKIETPLGTNDHMTLVLSDPPCRFNADNVCTLNWDVALPAVGANNFDVWMGLGDGDPFNFGVYYAAIIKASADTNWQTQSRDGTTTGSMTSLGVAPVANTLQHMKLVWVGANRSPTSAAQVRVSVNGAAPTTLTANLPGSATNPDLRLFFGLKSGTASSKAFYVGDVRFESSTWAGDVF